MRLSTRNFSLSARLTTLNP